MEPNYFKKFDFYKNDETRSQTQIIQCNIASCWCCTGRNKPSRDEIERLKRANKLKAPRKFNPKAPIKFCANKECKYCQRIINFIEEQKKEYYSQYELEIHPQNKGCNKIADTNARQILNISQDIDINQNSNKINLINDSPPVIENKIKNFLPSQDEITEVRGDGICAYRAILISLNEPEDYKSLRQIASNEILKSGISEDIYLERGCETLAEYAEKIRNTNLYADEPELRAISKAKNIWIAIFDSTRSTWKIIKNPNNEKPVNIAFISFKDTNEDLSSHYDAIKYYIIQDNHKTLTNNLQLEDSTHSSKLDMKKEKVKILVWNSRSLNALVKKLFLVDILRNETPDIALISETFLLDRDPFYAKNYRTYKTRNINRRKGCCILISKNILASVITLKNDCEGRYIMISLKSDGNDIPVTISAIYLEPNGDLNKIPVEIFDSDIIGGDLNNAETGLEKIGVYHLKGISNIRTIEINKKISDHNIKIGEAKVNLKTNDRLSTIVINDKNIVNANNNELMLVGQKDSIVLKSPKKTIIKDNYSMIPTDLDKYDNFNQIKEIYNYLL